MGSIPSSFAQQGCFGAMRLMLAVTSVATSYGGPAVSVSALAEALVRQGHDVALWSADDSCRTHEQGIESVMKLSGSLSEAIARFGRPDVIHDNGIWLPHNHALSRFAREASIPRVVSPRGMLSPWAKKHKRLKKELAWFIYQKTDLRTASCLHATSEGEASDLRSLFVRPPIISVIPNGLDTALRSASSKRVSPVQTVTSNTRTKKALFLGRLYPVKGLDILLEAWSKIRPPGWTLLVVGPDEASHLADLRRLCNALHLRDCVEFHGAVSGVEKECVFSQAKLFILPSLSESFGMVVLEAMARGIPVMVSNAAPWPEVKARNLGWWVPPTVDALSEALSEAIQLNDEELAEMGRRGLDYAIGTFSWRTLIGKYERMYAEATNAR